MSEENDDLTRPILKKSKSAKDLSDFMQTAEKLASSYSLEKVMKIVQAAFEEVFPTYIDTGYKIREAVLDLSHTSCYLLCGKSSVLKYIESNIGFEKSKKNNIHGTYLNKLSLSNTSNMLYISTSDSTILELNAENLALVRTFKTKLVNIQSIFYQETSDHLYGLSDTCVFSLKVFKNSENVTMETFFEGNFCFFSLQDEEIVLGGTSGELIRVDKDKKKFEAKLEGEIKVSRYIKEMEFILILTSKALYKLDLELEVKSITKLDFDALHMELYNDEKNIIISSSEGKIFIIDVPSEQMNKIPIHTGKIVSFYVDLKSKTIITFGRDSKIGMFGIPIFKQSITISSNHSNFIFYGPDTQIILLENSKILKLCNIQDGTNTILYENIHTISKPLHYMPKEDLLVFSDLTDIIFYSVKLQKVDYTIKLKSNIELTIITSDGDSYNNSNYIFTLANENNFIYFYNLLDFSVSGHLKGHSGKVSCIVSIKNTSTIATGSKDNKIIIWNYIKRTRKRVLEGHQDHITALCTSQDSKKLISGSKDGKVKVWSLKGGVLLITLASHCSPIAKVWIDSSAAIVSVSNDGVMINWNQKIYEKNFVKMLGCKITKLKISNDSKLIAYSNNATIKILNTGVSYNNLDVIGPNMQDKYEYMSYVLNILKGEKFLYESKWDDWSVLPFKFNTVYFYCYRNLYYPLKTSLLAGKSLTPALFSDPYSIVINKDYQKCLKLLFKINDKLLKKNPHSVSFINFESIIDLNLQGHSDLPNFYESIFRKYQLENFPKLIKTSELPKFLFSDSVIPSEKDFFGTKKEKIINKYDKIKEMEEKFKEMINVRKNQSFFEGIDYKILEEDNKKEKSDYTNEKKSAVVLYLSCISLNYYSGSKQSIEFISSLLKCPNKEIFRTKFIQSLMTSKWKNLKNYQFIQAGCYLLYLINLSIYLICYYDEWSALIGFTVVCSLFSLYDFYQMGASFKLFWRDIWNYFDLFRIISIITYFISSYYLFEMRIHFIQVLSITSFIRGIAFFRLFDSTRYLIQLLISVVKDIRSFAAFLTYTTVSFSIVFMLQDQPNVEAFSDYLTYSFIFNIGQVDVSKNNGVLDWLIFGLAAILNLIILLNMIIAIMGETFSRVRENIELADCLEITEMVLEVETSFYFNRHKGEKTYFHLCEAESTGGKDDMIAHNINSIKRYVKKLVNLKKKPKIAK